MFRRLYKFDGPIFGWRAHTRGEGAHIRDVNWVNWSIFGGAYIRGEGVLTRLYGILYRNKASIINIWPLF